MTDVLVWMYAHPWFTMAYPLGYLLYFCWVVATKRNNELTVAIESISRFTGAFLAGNGSLIVLGIAIVMFLMHAAHVRLFDGTADFFYAAFVPAMVAFIDEAWLFSTIGIAIERYRLARHYREYPQLCPVGQHHSPFAHDMRHDLTMRAMFGIVLLFVSSILLIF